MEYLIGILNYAVIEEPKPEIEYLTKEDIGTEPGDLVTLNEEGKIPKEFYDSGELKWIIY